MAKSKKVSNGRVTTAELADSLDELFMQLAEQTEKLEALEGLVRKRDSMNLLMVEHVKRLVREKEVLLMHLGLQSLEQSMKPAASQEINSEFESDLDRYLKEVNLADIGQASGDLHAVETRQ